MLLGCSWPDSFWHLLSAVLFLGGRPKCHTLCGCAVPAECAGPLSFSLPVPSLPHPPVPPSLPTTYHSILVATHDNREKASSPLNNHSIRSPQFITIHGTVHWKIKYSTYLMLMLKSMDAPVIVSAPCNHSWVLQKGGKTPLIGDRRKESKNRTCIQTAFVVSAECPEAAVLKCVWKRHIFCTVLSPNIRWNLPDGSCDRWQILVWSANWTDLQYWEQTV